MSYLYPGFFLHRKRKSVLISDSHHKDLKIASLEGLLEDKKREAIGFRAKVLRGSIRSLQRQLERIEGKQDGI